MLVIEGAIYGLILLPINIMLENIYVTNIPFYLVGFAVLAITKTPTMSIASLIPGIIYYFILKDINVVTFSSISIVFALLISITFALFFSNNFIARAITYPTFIGVSIIL